MDHQPLDRKLRRAVELAHQFANFREGAFLWSHNFDLTTQARFEYLTASYLAPPSASKTSLFPPSWGINRPTLSKAVKEFLTITDKQSDLAHLPLLPGQEPQNPLGVRTSKPKRRTPRSGTAPAPAQPPTPQAPQATPPQQDPIPLAFTKYREQDPGSSGSVTPTRPILVIDRNRGPLSIFIDRRKPLSPLSFTREDDRPLSET